MLPATSTTKYTTHTHTQRHTHTLYEYFASGSGTINYCLA